MKKHNFTKCLLIFSLLIIFISGCKKDDNNNPPTCIIKSPLNGQDIAKGSTITIKVEAEDNDGNITEVRFYIDGIGMGSANSFPYNYSWNTGYETLGDHKIKATSYDNNGSNKSDEISVNIIQSGDPPNATFDANPTSGFAPLTVSFTDQSTNNPTSWQWDFGDGGNSSIQNPLYTYNTSGTYTVTLTVSNSYGTDTETKTDYIFVDTIICPPSFTDNRDGNVYSAVMIGSQCWMAENLAYLPFVSPSSSASTTTPYYYVYDYQGTNVTDAKATANYQTYGVLYNWPAAMDGAASSNSVPSGIQGICPNGWHLPSDEELKMLEGEVDSQYVYPDSEWDNTGWRGTDVGGNLKETSTTHWNSPNTGATNSSGFSALPGGYRRANYGTFDNLGYHADFWCSTEFSSNNGWRRALYYDEGSVYRREDSKSYGFSVRCIKD